MNQENEDAKVIAAECIRQSEEGCYERSLFRRAGELIQQLIAELEAAGRWFPMSEPQVQCAKTIAQGTPARKASGACIAVSNLERP